MTRHAETDEKIKKQMLEDEEYYDVDQQLLDAILADFGDSITENMARKAIYEANDDYDEAAKILEEMLEKKKKKQDKKNKNQEKKQKDKPVEKPIEKPIEKVEKEEELDLPEPIPLQQRNSKGQPRRKISSEIQQIRQTRKASYVVEDVDTTRYNEYPKVNDQEHKPSDTISVVIVGHVDSGKSTLVGQLLFQLNEVSKKQMHKNQKQAKEQNREASKFARVMDEYQLEKQKGITIDVGVKSIMLQDKRIVFLDSPGHKQYIPNMISGAVQADYAILVVDCIKFETGFKFGGQTKQHAYIVRALGVGSIIVAMNKMDLVDWKEEVFLSIRKELSTYLIEIGFQENKITFVPISAFLNINLIEKKQLPYYNGPPLVKLIMDLQIPPRPVDKPFRMKITNVYESYTGKLRGHCISGKIEGGVVRKDDKLIILPQNCQCLVKEIVGQDEKIKVGRVGDNIDCQIKLIDETFFEVIKTGNVLSSIQYSIPVGNHFIAEILTFELDLPLLNGSEVVVYIGSSQCTGNIMKIKKIFDSKNRNVTVKENPKAIHSNQCCQVEMKLNEKVCIEMFSNYKGFGRVILRSNYSTVAVGIVKTILPDR